MESSEPRNVDGADRALSPLVAVVILFGLVVVSAATVFVAGSSAVFAVQEETNTEQATRSMTSIASDLESGGETDVRLPDDGSTYVDGDSSWMRVEVENETVVDEDEGRLGTLYYENDGTTVAYEGGGVWRRDAGERSTMLTPPPMQYARGDDPTLALPVISIAEADGPATRERLSTVETEKTFPNANVTNPITGNVTITVESSFYDAWGAYFEDQFDADVSYDSTAMRTEVVLQGAEINRTVETVDNDTAPPAWNPPEQGGIPGFVVNEGSELDARQNLRVDSYDSSNGSYSGNANSDGDIKTTGKLDLSNDVVVEGDVDAGGTAKISNNVEVTGDLIVGEGDDTTYTTIDTSSGPATTIGGVFSTKEDAEVSGGVQFGDDVIVGGDLRSLEATVDGDVYVHGDMVDINDDYDGQIKGDLVVAGAVNWNESDVDLQIDGEFVRDPEDDQLPQPLEPAVEIAEPNVSITQKGEEFREDNDNDQDYGGGYYGGGYGGDADGPIEDRRLQNCGTGGFTNDGCTLTAGQYYLEEIDLYKERGGYHYRSQPEQLTLDTTDGPVEIYVDGDVAVEDVASIQVRHDSEEHPVRMYVNGEFDLTRGAEVRVPGDRSPLFEMYMQPDQVWRIEGGSQFTGSVYGLSDGTQRTTVHLSGGRGSSIYGGVLGDIGQFDQEGRVHYDESLRETDVDRPDYEKDLDDDSDDDQVVRETVETDAADVVYLHVDRRTVAAD